MEAEVVRGPGEGEKRCAHCGEVKPLTAFYFHRDTHTDDGWCPKCKLCRAEYRENERNKEIAQSLEKIERGILKKIADGDGRQPLCDVVTGSEVLLQAFGGIEGLAQKLVADYEGAKQGTAGRTKLLLGALAFVAKGMEKQQPMDLGVLSDDELKEALQRALGQSERRITEQSEDSTPVGDSE